MFREDDNEERRKPVSHAQKEGVKDGSEMISSSDSSNDVNDDTHEGPQESRDLDCPISENLSGQSELAKSVCGGDSSIYRIVVGDIVCNNGEGQKYEAELSKSSNRSKNGAKKASNGAMIVRVSPVRVDGCSSHACSTCD